MALSTKQKWMIGCGGCLMVIVVIIGILIAIGFGIKSTSDKSVNNIFGPTPSGYVALGFPLDMLGGKDATTKDFAMLISQGNKTLWLAFDMKMSAEEKALFQSADLPKLQAHLTSLMQENASSSQKSKVEDVSVTGINTLHVEPSNQKIRVIQLKVTSEKGVMPAIVSPIHETTGNTLLLVGVEPDKAQTSDTNDFGPSYMNLSQEASRLISNTSIHKRMAATALK